MTQEDVTGDRPDDDTSALIGVAPSTARASSLARSVARSVAFGRVRSVGSVGPSTARGGRARSFIHSFVRSVGRIDMTVVSDGEETDAELAAYVETAMTTAMASSTSRARRTRAGTGTMDGGTRGARGGGRRGEEDGGADVDGDGGVARTGGGGGGGRRRRRGRRRGVDGEDELDGEEDEDDVGEDIGGRGADERDADADAVDDERGEDEMEDGVEDETARIVRLGPRGRARIRGGTTGRRVDARVTETTEDEDEDEDEDGARRREAKREIGHLAVWSVASAKPGNGVELLRDDDLGTFWQSDGAQPHLVSAQFQHKAEMCEIALWCEYKMDESYTPSLVSVRAGTSCHDLREVRCVELEHPNGWVRVPLGDAGDASCLRAYFIQVAILANHQNGRDTHVRQIKIFGPRRDQARALGRSRQLDLRSTAFSRYAGVR